MKFANKKIKGNRMEYNYMHQCLPGAVVAVAGAVAQKQTELIWGRELLKGVLQYVINYKCRK